MTLDREQKYILGDLIRNIFRSIDEYTIGHKSLDPYEPATGKCDEKKMCAIIHYITDELSHYYGCKEDFLYRDKKFAYRNKKTQAWLLISVAHLPDTSFCEVEEIHKLPYFDPLVCYAARNIIEEDFAKIKELDDREDWELVTLYATYTA